MKSMKPIKERIFHRIFRISRYYAWWVFIIVLLLTGATAYYVRNIPIHSSFLDLLPQNDPLIDDYRHTEESLLQSDYLALLVSLKDTNGLTKSEMKERLLTAGQAIKETLEKDQQFLDVSYTREVAPEIPDQYLVLYRLNKDELAHIEESVAFAETSISSREQSLPAADLATTYQQVNSAFMQALSAGDADDSDRSGMADLKTQIGAVVALNNGVINTIDELDDLPSMTAAVNEIGKVFAPSAAETVRTPEPYLSSDGTKLLVSVRPRLPSETGVAYSTAVMKDLYSDLDHADLDALGVTIGVTGTYSYNDETNSVINSDMQRTTIISSIGVLVIFFLAFGSISYSIIALIPLLVSVVLTMGWAKFAVGGFNLVTTFLPALVLGLGIDYGIHLISRYAEERNKGSSLNRALHLTVWRKGEASFAAASTTALVFLGLLLSRSRALFEMGVITSMGVILAFLTTLFFLPTLITLFHFVFRFRHRENVINYTPHLTRFFRFVTGKGRAIFVIVIILTFFIAFQAAQTRFVFSSRDMIPKVKSQVVLNEILDSFGEESALSGDTFTFFANDEEQLNKIVNSLKTSSLVEGTESALTLLPVNLAQQKQVLDRLDISTYIDQLTSIDQSLSERSAVQAQIRTLLGQFGFLQYLAGLNGEVQLAVDGNTIQTQLLTVQDKLGAIDVGATHENILALQQALQNLDRALSEVRDLPSVEALLRDILKSLPEGIRGRFLAPDGSYIVQARMAPEIYDGDNLQNFNSFVSTFSDKYFGMPLVAGKLEDYMRRDFLVSTVFAMLMITITMWRSLGGWLRALLAASPLILGYVWMLGGMRLLQVNFNFINIIISPLLIGVGVDNGIHILHRYIEEREENPDGAVERGGRLTAVAVLVTSLTTMLVFGSLLIARTPALRLLGISALLGIGFALLFSLLFLPAILQVKGDKWV